MALAHTTREAIWLRNLLDELGYEQRATTIYEDNQPCIALGKNPVNYQQTKHIDVRHHFSRDKVENGDIILTCIDKRNGGGCPY
ncbi:hypothetical protein SpCBS45565_g04800 [Spizellomyces sp. 'palustris']|nr:hypothetical protein SpCBS45565_g04800 [Spizellomyces sp. 'palustris']